MRLREAIDGSTATLLAGGHTHHQLLRRFDGQWLINPGSVGLTHRQTQVDQPTGAPPWAEYGIVTVENGAIDVSLRAIPLDLERVRAQAPRDDAASGGLAVRSGHQLVPRIQFLLVTAAVPLTSSRRTSDNQPNALGSTGVCACSSIRRIEVSS